MLDIRRFRSDPDALRTGLSRRGGDAAANVDRIIELDVRQRALGTERDDLRARVKVLSKDVGRLQGQGDAAGAESLMAESRALGERAKVLDVATDAVALEMHDLLLRTPNLPAEDCPDGRGEADNVVLRIEGFDPEAYDAHQRVPHWDIGTELGIIDGERAAKISGSMFTMYRGWGARLLRGMVQLSLDRCADKYEEIRPPTLVRTDTMISTGHLPKFDEEAYYIERDDLWAIPTAEVPLTSLHSHEVLTAAELPLRYCAYTSCFRREAGAAGRDTRGLLRSHEFDKVELFALVADAEQAVASQNDILARSEALLGELGLAYRILDLCTGDLGGSAARTWDIEAYAPGCDLWLEVSSVSWFADYQARRANIRHRIAGGKGTDVCHTVNGSAMGWPRTVAAYLETHRQPDGSIAVVPALQPYLAGVTSFARR